MFAWENSEFCQRQGTTLTNDYTVLGLILPSNAPLLYLTFDHYCWISIMSKHNRPSNNRSKFR